MLYDADSVVEEAVKADGEEEATKEEEKEGEEIGDATSPVPDGRKVNFTIANYFY